MSSAVRTAADYNVSTEKLARLAATVEIPPCPKVIAELVEEKNRPDPDPRVLAKLAGQDPAISAALLKTVNSPFFGLSVKIVSITQAVQFLGIPNVINIITAIALREASHAPRGRAITAFWEQVSQVAAIAAALADRVIGVARDEAYIHTLFRDAAIPVLLQQRVKRGELDASALNSDAVFLELVAEEQKRIDHTVIGFKLATEWLLPDHIRLSVRNHHNLEVFIRRPEAGIKWVALLVAVGHLAEHVWREYREIPHEEKWEDVMLDAVLRFVGLEYFDFRTLTEEIIINLRNDMLE